ncbi:MAG TPA: hypothetical protein VMZ27_02730 [Candidatus Saccharimonadales bacterium]|nr:hypothetical protein [Candidatus Saccharimonadales bacterium]
MSWDAIFVKTTDPNFLHPAEHAGTMVMGPVSELQAKVKENLPSVEWTQPGYGHARIGSLSLEFSMLAPTVRGAAPRSLSLSSDVDSIGVAARGSGDPLGVIVALAKSNHWSVIDSQEGTWMNLAAPNSSSWKEFTGFRDKVAGRIGESTGRPTEGIGRNLLISAVFFVALVLVLVVVFRRR